MSPRAGFRRQSWISRSASGNRQRFPIDRVAAKPNGKWNRIEPLRSGYKVRNLYCMFTGDDHCAASNDRNSIMRSACGSKSSSSERNFSNIYYAYLHVYLIIDIITNLSMCIHVERQILISNSGSSLKFTSFSRDTQEWKSLSVDVLFPFLSAWNEREKRRFVARYKKNPGLDKLLDFRLGCSREEGSRGRQRRTRSKGRKREDEGNWDWRPLIGRLIRCLLASPLSSSLFFPPSFLFVVRCNEKIPLPLVSHGIRPGCARERNRFIGH